ncbi:uncharacterized protein E0L32_006720 [Thyridium curvatum]|uniref:Uncharacterized protein n=1 Tax=Thyridium curvatum TaxID=1093900 RepID=A0A507B875_9PEZI|nr:uncharacterized protein E0L32_006720 [Thyridium curvatum]TPX12840.1 hypothetical protein E0L32_006720 [Thyridium curvatum]
MASRYSPGGSPDSHARNDSGNLNFSKPRKPSGSDHSLKDGDMGSRHAQAQVTTQAAEEPLLKDDTAGGGRETKLGNLGRRLGWKQRLPFHLGPLFLVPLIILFALMIGALEVLRFFSDRDRGIVVATEDRHYLWTYGPTLILTIVAALWGQLEYRAKQVMPWAVMNGEQGQSGKGLLLDYLSPISFIALFQSVKRRHFLVTLGISGTLVLRVLIIVSTGLLSLRSQQLAGSTNITTLDRFNLSQAQNERATNAGVTLWTISQQNASYPAGTTPKVSVQSFIGPGDSRANTLAGNVSVFEASTTCDKFYWQWDKTTKKFNFPLNDLLSEDEKKLLNPLCSYVEEPNNEPTINQLSSTHFDSPWALDPCDPKLKNDFSRRIFLSMSYPLEGNMRGASAVLCNATYTITRREVTTTWAGGAPGDVRSVSNEILETLPLGTTPAALTGTLVNPFGPEVNNLNPFPSNRTTWFSVMNFTQPQADLRTLSSLDTFPDLFQRVFKSAAAQVIKGGYSNSAANQTQVIGGLMTFDSQRLVVENVSLRVMESLLGLMILVCVVLCVLQIEATFPRDLGSLMAMASVLSQSPGLTRALSGTSDYPKEHLDKTLDGYDARAFMTGEAAKAKIEVRDMLPRETREQIKNETSTIPPLPENEWWMPVGGAASYRIGLIVLTCGLVAALEALYQTSIKNRGLLQVSTEGYAKYGWLFLPTLTMALVAISYTTIDFAARTLHPYRELRRLKENNVDTMVYDPFARTTLLAVPHALGRRYVALSAAMITSVLGPLLTIAASGLFTPTFVPATQNMTLKLDRWFDISNSALLENKYALKGATGGTPADVVVNQAIQYNNLSYSQWTYDEFAFASINPDTFRGQDMSNRTLEARLPAARAQLNCTPIEAQKTTFQANGLGFYIPITAPPGCKAHEDPANTTLFVTNQNVATPDDGFFAHWASVFGSIPQDLLDLFSGALDIRTPYSACGDDTQHLFFIYGHQTGNVTDDLTVLHCMPYVEALLVDVSLRLPSLEIDDQTSPPPRAVEGTARPFDRVNATADSIPFPFPATGQVTGRKLDAFFTMATVGRDGTPLGQLMGRDNAGRMLRTMNHLFAQLCAQTLGLVYRVPMAAVGATSTAASARRRQEGGNLPSSSSNPLTAAAAAESVPGADLPRAAAATGTLLGGATRLEQSSVSTRILEGLLLGMAVAAAASFALGGGVRVLPKNPGSLAARMSLLADSELVERLRDGRVVWGGGDGRRGGASTTRSGEEQEEKQGSGSGSKGDGKRKAYSRVRVVEDGEEKGCDSLENLSYGLTWWAAGSSRKGKGGKNRYGIDGWRPERAERTRSLSSSSSTRSP